MVPSDGKYFIYIYGKVCQNVVKIVNLASISFKVFKPIIMILVVVLRASIVVVFPGILTNYFLHPKRYCYFSTKRQGLLLPEYLAILKGLSYIFLLKLHILSCFFMHIWCELWVFQMYISQKPTLQTCDIGCALAGLSNGLSVSSRKGTPARSYLLIFNLV